MLAGARVGGRWEGGQSGSTAGLVLEGVWSFALVVAGWECRLDAQD